MFMLLGGNLLCWCLAALGMGSVVFPQSAASGFITMRRIANGEWGGIPLCVEREGTILYGKEKCKLSEKVEWLVQRMQESLL